MKTKIIPFDLETAKKIQAGEVKGKVKTRNGHKVRIVLWNKKDEDGYVILALIDKPGTEYVVSYTLNGEITKGYEGELDLVLEVPDEPQFKPFDKVLVRKNGFDKWKANFFSHMDDGYYKCVNSRYKECVLFKGNEHLIGTTNKPNED